MNSEFGDLISLVGYGNLFLSDRNSMWSELPEARGGSSYVPSYLFARYRLPDDASGVTVAESIADWMSMLRAEGVEKLKVIVYRWGRKDLEEHVAEGFSGGVPRSIQSSIGDRFEYWYPKWTTGGPREKPWLVEYRSLVFPADYAIPTNLQIARDRLAQILSRAEKFAGRPEWGTAHFADMFAKARQSLATPEQALPDQSQMIPIRGYSIEARQLLSACSLAWVFGGMGSWNDIGFSDEQVQGEYEAVSKELYASLVYGAVAAANSFAL